MSTFYLHGLGAMRCFCMILNFSEQLLNSNVFFGHVTKQSFVVTLLIILFLRRRVLISS